MEISKNEFLFINCAACLDPPLVQFCAKYLDKIQLENSSEPVILPPPIYKAVTECQGVCGPSHSFGRWGEGLGI